MRLFDAHTQTKKDAQAFLTLPDEKILVAKRKHWLTLLLPLIAIFFFGLLGFCILLFLFFFLPFITITPLFTFALFVGLITLIASFGIKLVIAWYFRLYIVTNHKILHMSYTPLGLYWSNSILLDQVRCTEIDIQTNGIINQLLNKGNIVITFDRPTHEEEFMFADIKDPRQTGAYLADIFESQGKKGNDTILYAPKRRAFSSFAQGNVQAI